MVYITNPKIEEYIDNITPDAPKSIRELEAQAKADDFSIVDRQVGRLLHALALIHKPRLVVELGSGFGYSAYWFASAMSDGKVVLTEYDNDKLERAKLLFKREGLLSRADFRQGEAVQIAKSYDNIDILFIDIEKERYLEAVKELFPYIRSGGMVIADNSLWYGKILALDPDAESRGILEFNDFMYHSGYFFSVNMPLRDGVLIGIKQ